MKLIPGLLTDPEDGSNMVVLKNISELAVVE
jgi:hypothetical protein